MGSRRNWNFKLRLNDGGIPVVIIDNKVFTNKDTAYSYCAEEHAMSTTRFEEFVNSLVNIPTRGEMRRLIAIVTQKPCTHADIDGMVNSTSWY